MFFAIGLYGLLTNRDIVRIFISLSIMLASVALNLAAFSSIYNSVDGQAYVLFIWVIEVIEIIIALSMFLYLSKKGITDINELNNFKG
jgi:NADH:ubiquinone oxidoreductase subunit K